MTGHRLISAAVLIVATACASAPRSPGAGPTGGFPVGVAQIDITPAVPIRLTGYGNRSMPSEGVRQRLWAKALAFGSDRQQPAILITSDLIGIPRHISEAVSARLRKAGIERAQLAITSTHTHTGPSLAETLPFIFSVPATPEQQAVIDAYSAGLVDKLERVALDALADRAPAQVAWMQGAARFAANRRVLKDGKWTGFGIAPAGPVDHDLPVLTVRGPKGALRAVLVSYACHATTLEGSHNFVHGDWPGAAQELIQKRHPGVVAMVTIGAGADANPNPRGGGLADVAKHAEEIAGEVDRLLADTPRPLTTPPAGRFRYLDLPLSRTPGREELERQSAAKDAIGFYARALLDRLNRGEALPQTVAYPVQVWRWGRDLAMVFLGGEVVSDYSLRLKRELDASSLWVNAYSNDVAFYVASRRMIPQGGYEVDRSMVYYGIPAPLGEGTEDRIIGAVRDWLPGFVKSAGGNRDR